MTLDARDIEQVLLDLPLDDHHTRLNPEQLVAPNLAPIVLYHLGPLYRPPARLAEGALGTASTLPFIGAR